MTIFNKQIITAAFLTLFSSVALAVPVTGANMTAQLGIELGGPFIVQDTDTFTVGPGVDSTNVAGIAEIDVSESSIILRGLNISFSTNCCTFNGYRFFDTDGVIDDFVHVSINQNLTTAIFDPSQLSFTADEIRLDWIGASTGVTIGDIVLNIRTSKQVPEPATLLLGLAGLAFIKRKRR